MTDQAKEWTIEPQNLTPQEPTENAQGTREEAAATTAELDIQTAGGTAGISELLETQPQVASSLLLQMSYRLKSYLDSIEKIGYQESGLRPEEAKNLEEIMTLFRAETTESCDPEIARQLIAKFEEALRLIIEDLEAYKSFCIKGLLETIYPDEFCAELIQKLIEDKANRAMLIEKIQAANAENPKPYLAKFQERFPNISVYLRGDNNINSKKYYDIIAKLFSSRCLPALEKLAKTPPITTLDPKGQTITKTPLTGEVLNKHENDLRFGLKNPAQVSEELGAIFDNTDHQKIARLMIAFYHCPGQLNNSLGVADTLQGNQHTVDIIAKQASEISAQIIKDPSDDSQVQAFQESQRQHGMYSELLKKFIKHYLSSLKRDLIELDPNSLQCSVERSISVLKGLLNPPTPKSGDPTLIAVDHKSPEI